MTMSRGDKLWQRLDSATPDELQEVAKINDVKDVTAKSREVLVEEVSKQLRANGGHTIANWFREDHELPYKGLLVDVADKLAPGWGWTEFKTDDAATEESVEEYIWGRHIKLVQEKLAELKPEERAKLDRDVRERLESLGASSEVIKQAGVFIGGGALAAAGATTLAVELAVVSGWFAGIWAGLFGPATWLIAVAGGTIFAVVAVPSGLFIAGGPAYRKTVPSVIRLIGVRKRLEIEQMLTKGAPRR